MKARRPSVLDQDFLDKYFQIERANFKLEYRERTVFLLPDV